MDEDYEDLAKQKLERQESANKTRKYPVGMTYEEINSSRSTAVENVEVERRLDEDTNSDADSVESIEPLQEKDLKATGPDPFEKLNYKIGEKRERFISITISSNIRSH